MGLIERFFMNRYIKSIVRYALVALVVYLNRQVEVPYLAGLVDFLNTHQEKLVEVITAIIVGVVSSWSFFKNRANGTVEKVTQVRTR